MILPIASALRGIDSALDEAREASARQVRRAFWTVTFPLSLPGVGAMRARVLAQHRAFVLPALIGSERVKLVATMIYQQVMVIGNVRSARARRRDGDRDVRADRPAPYCRGLGGMSATRSDPSSGFARRRAGRCRARNRAARYVALFSFHGRAAVVVIGASFEPKELLRFPPHGWSLRWY